MPAFRPLPPSSKSPERTSSGQGKLTYTSLCLAAMRVGYTRSDLFRATYSEIAWAFEAMRLRDGGSDETEQETNGGAVREATQDDIRRMLG